MNMKHLFLVPKQSCAFMVMRPLGLIRLINPRASFSSSAVKWEGGVSMVQGASRGIGLEFVSFFLICFTFMWLIGLYPFFFFSFCEVQIIPRRLGLWFIKFFKFFSCIGIVYLFINFAIGFGLLKCSKSLLNSCLLNEKKSLNAIQRFANFRYIFSMEYGITCLCLGQWVWFCIYYIMLSI